VSAVGLVYRQEFDTFQEFLRRLLFFKGNKGDSSKNEGKKEPVLNGPVKNESSTEAPKSK
jgi:hypothetical protein